MDLGGACGELLNQSIHLIPTYITLSNVWSKMNYMQYCLHDWNENARSVARTAATKHNMLVMLVMKCIPIKRNNRMIRM